MYRADITYAQGKAIEALGKDDPSLYILGHSVFRKDWPIVGLSNGQVRVVYPSGYHEPCHPAHLAA